MKYENENRKMNQPQLAQKTFHILICSDLFFFVTLDFKLINNNQLI